MVAMVHQLVATMGSGKLVEAAIGHTLSRDNKNRAQYDSTDGSLYEFHSVVVTLGKDYTQFIII